jgi:hypothetical protein
MNTHPLTHATLEGPLGFPQTERQAMALDTILKALPKDDAFRYRKAVVAKAASELLPGERSDVSWITTEDPDRTAEVVLARGMNDSQFKLNPIVTLQHAYYLPPVGRSLWRKVVRVAGGDAPASRAVHGVKAKTQYPVRPADWPTTQDWPADIALSLVQADLLRGKSIGFLPTKVHVPASKEIEDRGWAGGVDLVIDEWILLEYACTFLPAQQNAVVEAVSKSAIQLPEEFIKAMGLDPTLVPKLQFGNEEEPVVPQGANAPRSPAAALSRFTPLDEIEKALCRQINALDLRALAERTARAALDRARGRV